jgi:class 3 adenylate cyclase/DNA-binding SARP family transcriptional activator
VELSRFRILGPIEVIDGGERRLAVGGRRQLALLAFLLLHANEAVSGDAVSDAVWGSARSRSDNRLPMAVARLRRALAPLDRSGEPILRTVGGCYALSVKPGELDAEAFGAAVQAGRRALQAAEAERAAELLAKALGLWRGTPLAEVAFEDFAQAETRRLEELRQVAIESRIDAELQLGHHRELIGELEALAIEQPVTEGLAAQLMVALYRCGRQADALDVYRRTRTHLAEELGLEPGPALKALQTQILEQAPSLHPPRLSHAVAQTGPTPSPPADGGSSVPLREHRKTVTVLFVDVVGSTVLGAVLDPEALRRVMLRYYETLRGAIESHGGSVQKFIGDAVVGIFGVPAVHEDDPLRAVRAAVGARHELERLNDQLEVEFDIRLEVRAGINTGEVVVGGSTTGEDLFVGDVLNVAARLEQSAPSGETLIGEDAYASVSHAVRADRVELAVKGRAEPLAAFRLVEVVEGPGRRAPRRQSSLVGRAHELGLITDAYARIRGERSCQSITVLGPAGVGKSRLIEEAAAHFQDATVVFGRCLSYGDGITFWPLIEILRAAADIRDGDSGADVQRKLAALMSAETNRQAVAEVAGILTTLIGARDGAAHVDESFWAVRMVFDAMARNSPLVVVFEDVHWAEPTLLDLIEYLVDMSRDARLLIVCVARAELLEGRPGWSGSGHRRTIVHLEPLSPRASAQLIENLLPGAKLPHEVLARIATGSDGFPLFVEEMIAMLLDDGLIRKHGGVWSTSVDLASVSVPSTIRSLLASRLDSLPEDERGVLELASVIGQEFWREAVAAIGPGEISGHALSVLGALVRKELIVPVRSTVIEGDSFRFRHILIRDAAYESLAKAERAALHERFASWLESAFIERLTEVEEIVGYHLAEAHRLMLSPGPRRNDLALRAAAHLGAAARRAFARGDFPTASSLFDRALTLSPSGSTEQRQLSLEAGDALFLAGQLERAAALLETVRADAEDAQDALRVAHARIQLAIVRSMTDPEGAADHARSEAAATLPIFEAADDHLGIGHAFMVLGTPDDLACRFGPMIESLEQARDHLRAAGQGVLVAVTLVNLANAATLGPTPIPDAMNKVREILADPDVHRFARAIMSGSMGLLLALAGHELEALEVQAEGEALIREDRMEFTLGGFAIHAGVLLRCVGRLHDAERLLREAEQSRARLGERANRSTLLALLGDVIVRQGRIDEAEQIARDAIDLGSSDDHLTLAVAHGVLARALAERDDPAAEAAMRHAVALAEETDMLWVQGERWESLGEVLIARGRVEDGNAALRTALDRFDRKGATTPAARVRERLRVNMVDATAGVDQRSDV